MANAAAPRRLEAKAWRNRSTKVPRLGKTREAVGAGEEGDLLLGGLAFGDVDDDPFDFAQASVLVAHGGITILDPAIGSRTGSQAKFNRRGLRTPLRGPAPYAAPTFRGIACIDERLGPVRVSQFFRVVTEFRDVV